MARKNKDPFSTLAERPLSEVGKSQAALDFEEIAKERSIFNAAERLGTTPDALKKEAKEKGTNVLDLIKDKEKGASTKEKKPATTKLKKIQEQVQAESPAIDRTAEIERLKSEIKAGTYSVEDAAARAAGETQPKATPSKPPVIPAASAPAAVAPAPTPTKKRKEKEKPAESAKSPAKKPATALKESPPPAPAAKVEEKATDTEPKALTEADKERIQKAKDKQSRKADIRRSQEIGFSSDEIKKIAKKMELSETAVRANLGNQDFAARAVKVLNEPDGGVSVPTRSTINVVKPPTTESAATNIPESSPAPDESAEPTKSDSKKSVSKPRKRKTKEEKRTKLESEQAKFARQQMAAEGEKSSTSTLDVSEDQRRFGREQMAASGETSTSSPKSTAAEQQAEGASRSRLDRLIQKNAEEAEAAKKQSTAARRKAELQFADITKKPQVSNVPPKVSAELKKVATGPTGFILQGKPYKPSDVRLLLPAAREAAKQAGAEIGTVEKIVTETLETAAKQGKGAGEAIEQAAKGIPDKKTKLALGLIGAGLAGAAGYMAPNQPETVKGLIGKGGFRPTPEGTTPLAPTPTGQIEDVSKPIVKKQEPKKVIDEADESTKEVDEYIINEVPRENQPELQSTGQTLREKLETAKGAYRRGVDNVMLMKALEKIAEGLALWGAGAYGMKHGVDAVSGLKFSPIDWSDKMKALEKELDLAESEYTKGIELEEKKQKTETAAVAELAKEQQKEAKEQQKLVRGATVKQLEEADNRADSTIKAIDAGLNQMKTAQFQKMDDAEKEGALLAAASSAGIPIEAMRKEKGILFWKGQKFDEETARNVLLQQKKAVQALKNTISNQLFKARSGEEIAGSEEAPAAMVRVQAADGRVGQIPENKVEQFLKDNLGSKRL